jgi:hypothetical protein
MQLCNGVSVALPTTEEITGSYEYPLAVILGVISAASRLPTMVC